MALPDYSYLYDHACERKGGEKALKAAQAYFNDLREQSGKSLAELSRIISFCHGQNRVQ